MDNIKYKIVFKGEIIEGNKIEEVKENFAIQFKIDISKAEKYFSGQPHVLAKHLNINSAQNFKKAFDKMGAICILEQETLNKKNAEHIKDQEESQVTDNKLTVNDFNNQNLNTVKNKKQNIDKNAESNKIEDGNIEKIGTLIGYIITALIIIFVIAWIFDLDFAFFLDFFTTFSLIISFTIIIFVLGRLLSDFIILFTCIGSALLSHFLEQGDLLNSLGLFGGGIRILLILGPGFVCFSLLPNTTFFKKYTDKSSMLFKHVFTKGEFKNFSEMKKVWNGEILSSSYDNADNKSAVMNKTVDKK